jgi:fluoride ion exporter CrcB/FEX
LYKLIIFYNITNISHSNGNTVYPGIPVTTSELWANVRGSIIMGFLSEDRKLFKEQGRSENNETEEKKRDDSGGSLETVGTQTDKPGHEDPERGRIGIQKVHNAMKNTISLYIGLMTGFCGSFTSFSSNSPISLQQSNPALHQRLRFLKTAGTISWPYLTSSSLPSVFASRN